MLGDILTLAGPNELDYYSNIRVPDIQQMQLVLDEYVQQGILTPEQATYYAQDPSEFQKLMSDPKLKDAQMAALSSLQEYGNQGGLNAQAKGRLHDIAKEESVRERGAREAIMQGAQQRGVAGSGLEFLNLIKNQQDSASRAADRGTQVAADAEVRALDALMNSGKMAGDIRSQDFNEQARKAQAIDEINRFNTQNRMNVDQYNVGTRNKGQQYNLEQRQSVSDANTNMRNKQQAHNKGLIQQNWQNRMEDARVRSGASQRDWGRTSNAIGGIGDSIANLVTAGQDYYTQNQAKKKKPASDDWSW